MATLAKTSKFGVWNPKIKSKVDKSINHIPIGGGKRINLTDVVNVAINSYEVIIDGSFTAINSEFNENDYLNNFEYSGNKESPFPDIFCRAVLFSRIISLIQGRLGIRFETIQFLISMLNENFLPSFTSIAASGAELVKAVFDKSQSEFFSYRLSKTEASILQSGSFLSTGISCLIAAGTSNLLNTIDAVSAISCEAFGALIEPLDSSNFETYRQHRGQITSSNNIRLFLEGSRRVNTPLFASEVFQTIPQTTGPALELISTAIKSLEIELNSSESLSSSGNVLGFNSSQPLLALGSVKDALRLLADSSAQRTLALSGNATISSSLVEPLQSSPPTDLFLSCFSGLQRLQTELATELSVSLTMLTAAGSEAVQSSSASPRDQQDSKKTEKQVVVVKKEQSWTPEQQAKADAKRKLKDEKANQKAQLKEAKKSTGSSPSLVLGSGTTALCLALNGRRTATGADTDSGLRAALNPFDTAPQSFSCLCVKTLEQLRTGSKRCAPKIAKGARDFTPEQMRIREQAFNAIRMIFKRHGGVEIDTPVFELKEVLTGKYGEDSKLIYDLADQGGELLSLRYDLTVPFARFLAMNSYGNIKRYHIAKVYRRDQPQLSKGRYREFYQCDFDIAGNYSVMVADAEVLSVCAEILSLLPIGGFSIKLNHRVLLDAIFEISGVPEASYRPICSAVDKLDKMSWEEVRREMVEEKGLDAASADRIGQFVQHRGDPRTLWQQLNETGLFGGHSGAAAALKELQLLFDYLEAMGTLQYIQFDLSLARGLDYYTGVIYEAVLTDGGGMGSIAAGGRYDGLVGMFSAAGIQTPCVGVSIGVERVFAMMEKKAKDSQVMDAATVEVFVASIGAGLVSQRMAVARRLWQAGISAEYSHQDNPKFKKQLDESLERGIPFMVVFGEDEVSRGVVKVKDMVRKTEEEVPLEDAAALLLGKGCRSLLTSIDLDLLRKMEN